MFMGPALVKREPAECEMGSALRAADHCGSDDDGRRGPFSVKVGNERIVL